MNSTSSSFNRGYALALLSALILSTTAIFIRYLTQNYDMPALVLAFWRDVFVVLTLLPFFWLLKPNLLYVRAGHLLYLIVFGLILAVFNAFWTFSVSWNGAAISTVLVYTSAAFTAVLGWWFLKEKLGWVKLFAVTLSLGGSLLVSGVVEATSVQVVNLLGLLIGALSGFWYAMYSLMGRSAAQRGLNPWTTLFYTFGFAGVFLLIFNMLPLAPFPGKADGLVDLLLPGTPTAGWAILFLLAAGPTVLGFGLYNVSLVYLPSIVANLILTLEPAFTAFVAYFLLGERFTAAQMAGGLVILMGVLLLRTGAGLVWRVNPRGLIHYFGLGKQYLDEERP